MRKAVTKKVRVKKNKNINDKDEKNLNGVKDSKKVFRKSSIDMEKSFDEENQNEKKNKIKNK